MNKPTPIILLGSARNGTTMLCNMISDIPGVCSVQHELHWGGHESNIYENYKFWGKFDTLDDYIYFLEVYCSMDTFQITGLKKEKYFSKIKANDFMDFYFEMMDDFAIHQGSRYWLTKIDPQFFIHEKALDEFIDRLNKRYNEIKFVSIQRDINDVLISYLKMDGKFKKIRSTILGHLPALVLGVIRMSVHYFEINKIIANNKGLSFQFEEVIKNKKDCLINIFHYLGISNEEIEIKDRYKPNSSFRSDEKKDKNRSNLNYILFMKSFFDKIPAISKALLVLLEKLKPLGRKYPDYWRLKKEKYFFESFKSELEAESNSLRDVLLERNKTKTS